MKITPHKVASSEVRSFATPGDAAAANEDPEAFALRQLVSEFAAAVEQRLLDIYRREKRAGWAELEGWNATDRDGAIAAIRRQVIEQVNQGDPVDIAGFAAFWWNAATDE